MSGKGKRHIAKKGKELMDELRRPALRRICRRAGVKRISPDTFDAMRDRAKSFLEDVLRDTVTYTEHGKRKTIVPVDVVAAVKRHGQMLYGFQEYKTTAAAVAPKVKAKVVKVSAAAAADTKRKNEAAAKIQALFRGKKVRAELAAAADTKRKNQAAAKIQALVRGKKVRARLAAAADTKKKNEAAAKIQALVRGKKVRAELAAAADTKKKNEAAADTKKKNQAAAKIQALVRGKKVRAQLAAAAETKKKNQAAAKIQALVRGAQVRSKAKAKAKVPSSSSSSSGFDIESVRSDVSSIKSNSSRHSAAAAAESSDSVPLNMPVVGIKNLGVTCYSASVFQALAGSRHFMRALNRINHPACPLTHALKLFFTNMQTQSLIPLNAPPPMSAAEGKRKRSRRKELEDDEVSQSVDPTDFFETIGNLLPNPLCALDDGIMHDSHEFLSEILHGLKQEWDAALRANSPYSDLFESLIAETTSCGFCGHTELVNYVPEPIMVLQPDDQNKKLSLHDLWDRVFLEDSSNDKRKCDRCGRPGKVSSFKTLVKAPQVLILYINRGLVSKAKGRKESNTNHYLQTAYDVATPFTFRVPTFDPSQSDAATKSIKLAAGKCKPPVPLTYDFRSGVLRHSKVVQHYTCIGFRDNALHHMDDSAVTPISAEQTSESVKKLSTLVFFDVSAASDPKREPCA